MELTLWDALAPIPDARRAQGRRYPLPVLLRMIIMGLPGGR